MIWYKVSKYSYSNTKQIEPVEIITSTEKTVTIKEGTRRGRVNKLSNYDSYFETYKEAYDFLKNRKEKLVERYSTRLSDAEKDLKTFLEEYKEVRPNK